MREQYADMMELADMAISKIVTRESVQVQPLLSAPWGISLTAEQKTFNLSTRVQLPYASPCNVSLIGKIPVAKYSLRRL